MNTILDKIVASKRLEIEKARGQISERQLEQRLPDTSSCRDFRAALEAPGRIQVIAEIKKASPSAGILRAEFDPVAVARVYESHGAAAISVLTDMPFFQGSLAHLAAVGVSRYDMPEFMLVLPKMPLTASGKIVKRELVRWLTEGRVQPQPVHRRSPAAAEG